MFTASSVRYVITQWKQTDKRRTGEIPHDVRRIIAVKLINVVRHGSNHLVLVIMWQFLLHVHVKAHDQNTLTLHHTNYRKTHFCSVKTEEDFSLNGLTVHHNSTDRQFWHRCSKRKNVVIILEQCECHGRGLEGKVTVSLALDLRAVDRVVGIHRLRVKLTLYGMSKQNM